MNAQLADDGGKVAVDGLHHRSHRVTSLLRKPGGEVGGLVHIIAEAVDRPAGRDGEGDGPGAAQDSGQDVASQEGPGGEAKRNVVSRPVRRS
jgi:hypothetical protein